MRELKTEDLLTTADVAKYLGVAQRTVTEWLTQWVETGGQEGLPGFKIGKRQWRIEPKKLMEWLRSQGAPISVAIKEPIDKIGKVG